MDPQAVQRLADEHCVWRLADGACLACTLEVNPDLNPGLIRQMLLATAHAVPGVSRERQGAGAVSPGPAVCPGAEPSPQPVGRLS